MTLLTLDAELLSTVIKEIFGDLEIKGFKIQKASIKQTSAIGDYAEVKISNQATGRGLLFWYVPPTIHPEGIIIFLENNSGDTFSVDEFLTHKKLNSELQKSITLTNYPGSLQEKFEELLKAAKKIILQYLDNYLFGGKWEPVPIQWGDLK